MPQLAEEVNLLHTSICRALGDPKRILILYALNDQPMSVNALADKLGVPQPTASRHLSILRQRSLVTTERDGTTVVYSLAQPLIIEVLDMMRQIMRDILGRHLDTVNG